MRLGLFMMPLHPPTRDYHAMLEEDLEAVVHADAVGFDDVWVGEHFSSMTEPITSPLMFLAKAIPLTKRIRLCTGVLNLPQAWTVARQYGVAPPLARAMLRVWTPQGGEPVLAWTVSGAGNGINIDGVMGNRLEGDLSGYVAAYNAQWEAAIAGLRRLLAQPRSSSPSFSSSSDDSGSSSSSSYSSDDDSSSGTNYGTAAQNSWGAGDMEAYGRIESGTPTGDDCYRYGC
jgi:hypothetical protein